MKEFEVSRFANFFKIGIDHSKADVKTRERFTLNEEKSNHLLHEYKEGGGDGMLILSTCNRTEVYAFASCPRDLISLFCKYSGNDNASFVPYQSIAQNREAINHLFRVGSGLESKILGDFEIIGQIKKSYKFSKEQGGHNAFLDRLVNNTIQCSKRVKNETELSTGAASVAFAAVLQLKKYLETMPQPKVLLYGMGKMGHTTCENLVNQTGITDIKLINRTEEKAARLAKRFGLKHLDIAHLEEGLVEADIVIVATGAESPTVKASHFKSTKKRLLLDLSMPRNVESSLYSDDNFQVIDVDHLSEIAQGSIRNRQSQIPLAEGIVEEQIEDFYIWLESRRVAPTLQALREKMSAWKDKELQSLSKKFPEMQSDQADAFAEQILNRITGQFARQLKSGNDLNNDLRTIHHIFEL
jgi:glutamyl-tRNA reductase